MKTYQVVFDPKAMAEAVEAADYLAGFSPEHADRWFAGLRAAVRSLETLPARCGRAREAETLAADLRQLLYRSHRLIFRIEEDEATVRVLHVRHAARRTLGEPEPVDEDEEQP